MASSGRKFGNLSEAAKHRAVVAGQRYGLSKRAVAERYNRGTYNPFARGDPLQRVPKEWRRFANRFEDGSVGVDWAEAAQANMLSLYGDYFKWSEDRVVSNIDHASEATQRAMAMATADEIMQIALIQTEAEAIALQGQLPFDLKAKDFGYTRNGEWRNIFWYH